MRSRILCIALILAISLATVALAETPLGILTGLNWEDPPEAAIACIGDDVQISSYDAMQYINAIVSNPFGLGAETSMLNLVYVNDSLEMATLILEGADPQPYIDALSALYGEPIQLGENEYFAADIIAGLAAKTACVWKIGETRCAYLSEATQRNENPNLAFIFYAVLDPDERIEDYIFPLDYADIASITGDNSEND